MFEAIEKSATVTAGEMGQAEDISKEAATDVRGIPSCEERRRSSNMSNLSSSTSGKRSSSEFSSEFEEYFEAFQQRERKVKHIVIQEEATGPMDNDCGVRDFAEQAKFNSSLPKNITKPAAVRPQLDTSDLPDKAKCADCPSTAKADDSTNQNKHLSMANNFVDGIFSSVLSETGHQERTNSNASDQRDRRIAWSSPEQEKFLDNYACERSNEIVEHAVGDVVRKAVGFLDTDFDCNASVDIQNDHPNDEDVPSPEGKITASLYIAISRMAENMVNEGFKVVKETIMAEREPLVPDEPAPSISPTLLAKIENLADKLVSYAMKSAVTIGASHLAIRRRAHRARWGRHGVVSQELYLFADNFVQEIMHEALCFAREQMNITPSSKDRNESWLKPLEKEKANSMYFQAEFSPSFRGSSPNLRRRESVGSYRGGSYDERLGRRRTSSSGFRDSMLSDFEDELICSNVSSPGLQMLLGFHDNDKENNSHKRRASEPANHTDPEFEFSGTNDFLCSPLKKRACSMDCSSSRQVVLDWLSRHTSSSTCNLQQRQRSNGRTRTTSSHLDWYAQDLLVDAFNDAFVELFGGSYYTTQASSLSSAMSSQSELDRNRADATSSLPALNKFASSLASTVLGEACHSAEREMNSCGVEKRDNEHYPQLEAAADKLAKKVMTEALEIAKSEWTVYCNCQKVLIK